jgi:hypothetical protein
MKRILLALSALFIFSAPLFAADSTPSDNRPKAAAKSPSTRPALPKATLSAVAYGKHAKQVLDFYKADHGKGANHGKGASHRFYYTMLINILYLR